MPAASDSGWAAGVLLSVTGVPREQRATVQDLVEQAGGSYSPNLSRRCTHLAVPGGSTGDVASTPGGCSEKLRIALCNQHKWGLRIVDLRWLLESAKAQTRLDEAAFPAQHPLASVGKEQATANAAAVGKQPAAAAKGASSSSSMRGADTFQRQFSEATMAAAAIRAQRPADPLAHLRTSVNSRPLASFCPAPSLHTQSPSVKRSVRWQQPQSAATSECSTARLAASSGAHVATAAAHAAAEAGMLPRGVDRLAQQEESDEDGEIDYARLPMTQAGFIPAADLLQQLRASAAGPLPQLAQQPARSTPFPSAHQQRSGAQPAAPARRQHGQQQLQPMQGMPNVPESVSRIDVEQATAAHGPGTSTVQRQAAASTAELLQQLQLSPRSAVQQQQKQQRQQHSAPATAQHQQPRQHLRKPVTVQQQVPGLPTHVLLEQLRASNASAALSHTRPLQQEHWPCEDQKEQPTPTASAQAAAAEEQAAICPRQVALSTAHLLEQVRRSAVFDASNAGQQGQGKPTLATAELMAKLQQAPLFASAAAQRELEQPSHKADNLLDQLHQSAGLAASVVQQGQQQGRQQVQRQPTLATAALLAQLQQSRASTGGAGQQAQDMQQGRQQSRQQPTLATADLLAQLQQASGGAESVAQRQPGPSLTTEDPLEQVRQSAVVDAGNTEHRHLQQGQRQPTLATADLLAQMQQAPDGASEAAQRQPQPPSLNTADLLEQLRQAAVVDAGMARQQGQQQGQRQPTLATADLLAQLQQAPGGAESVAQRQPGPAAASTADLLAQLRTAPAPALSKVTRLPAVQSPMQLERAGGPQPTAAGRQAAHVEPGAGTDAALAGRPDLAGLLQQLQQLAPEAGAVCSGTEEQQVAGEVPPGALAAQLCTLSAEQRQQLADPASLRAEGSSLGQPTSGRCMQELLQLLQQQAQTPPQRRHAPQAQQQQVQTQEQHSQEQRTQQQTQELRRHQAQQQQQQQVQTQHVQHAPQAGAAASTAPDSSGMCSLAATERVAASGATSSGSAHDLLLQMRNLVAQDSHSKQVQCAELPQQPQQPAVSLRQAHQQPSASSTDDAELPPAKYRRQEVAADGEYAVPAGGSEVPTEPVVGNLPAELSPVVTPTNSAGSPPAAAGQAAEATAFEGHSPGLPAAGSQVADSGGKVFTGILAIIDSGLQPQEQQRAAAALEQGGGRIADGGGLCRGATHVVCQPEAALKWLSMGVGIVSPQWVHQSLRSGRQQRCLTVSADTSRHLPAASAAASLQQASHASGSSGSRQHEQLSNELSGSREARQHMLLQLAGGAAGAGGAASKGLATSGGGSAAHQQAPTPAELLGNVAWSVLEPPSAAHVDSDGRKQPSEEEGVLIIPDSEDEEAQDWARLCCVSASQAAVDDVIHEATAAGGSGSGSDRSRPSVAGQRAAAAAAAWQTEVVLAGPVQLTLLFPRDAQGELGMDTRSYPLPASLAGAAGQGPRQRRQLTAGALLQHIHGYYAEALSSQEQLQLLQAHPAAEGAAAVLRPAFLELAPLARGALLGARCCFEGLRKATREPAGAVYEVQLRC